MWEIIFVCLFCLYLLISAIPVQESEILKDFNCSHHKWETQCDENNENNYIVCTKCGYLPTSDIHEKRFIKD